MGTTIRIRGSNHPVGTIPAFVIPRHSTPVTRNSPLIPSNPTCSHIKNKVNSICGHSPRRSLTKAGLRSLAAPKHREGGSAVQNAVKIKSSLNEPISKKPTILCLNNLPQFSSPSGQKTNPISPPLVSHRSFRPPKRCDLLLSLRTEPTLSWVKPSQTQSSLRNKFSFFDNSKPRPVAKQVPNTMGSPPRPARSKIVA